MKASLLWVDLEMTGLSPDKDRIIEVAAVATDWEFHEIANYQTSVKVPIEFMKQRMVGDFWDTHATTRDELIERSSSPDAKPTDEVGSELIQFLKDNFVLDKPIYLAGNSIHQDRKFIEKEWPTLDKLLHYRMLDVSSWKIIFAQRGVKFTKPDLHRAMSDIYGSIDELKYYLKKAQLK